MNEMKVLVISGFLGAGKTTFIRKMIEKTGKRFVILENEYAGSSVDSTLLEEEGDMKVWELTEGCICCTMKNNFANKIMNISSLMDPEYLIVEATGIGYLSRIISNIQTVEHERIRLMQAVTIVDAASVLEKKFVEDDLYLDQVKSAQVIVLSKSEFCTEEELREAEQILRPINDKADIVTEHYSRKDAEWWNGLLVRYFDGQIASTNEEEENRWDSLTLNDVSIQDLPHLLVFMQDLADGKYGRIIRAKGFLPAGPNWYLCDLSGGKYQISWISPTERKSNVVFIGETLRKEELRAAFTENRPLIRLTGRPGGRRPSNIVPRLSAPVTSLAL